MLDWTARLIILMLIHQTRLALYCMNGDESERSSLCFCFSLWSFALYPFAFCVFHNHFSISQGPPDKGRSSLPHGMPGELTWVGGWCCDGDSADVELLILTLPRRIIPASGRDRVGCCTVGARWRGAVIIISGGLIRG
jgi:hypothetical protein